MGTLQEAKYETIDSVSDFLAILNKIKLKMNEDKTTLFFRGQRNKNWENVPSIFRIPNGSTANLVKYEREMFNQMVSRCPEEFKICENTFEYLVKMQHYGLPTRLLDMTENPLVALYFACLEPTEDNIDGRVIILRGKNEIIKNYDSDSVAIIANLAKQNEFNNFNQYLFNLSTDLNIFKKKKMDYENLLNKNSEEKHFSHQFLELFSEFEKFIIKNELSFHILKNISNYSKYNEYRDNLESILNKYYHNRDQFMDIKRIKEFCSITYLCLLKLRDLEENNYLRTRNQLNNLIITINQEKPYFDGSLLKLEALEHVLLVRPKMDNPRIIRQSGAFLIFGLKINSKSKADCPAEFVQHVLGQYFSTDNPAGFIIKGKNKKQILKELEALSISDSYLFPEIDHVATELKNNFEERLPKK